MDKYSNLGDSLKSLGISRRAFMKFCATTGSMMAIAPSLWPDLVLALEKAMRPSVIWLSFQECTGCTESLTRSHSPTLERLIFDVISLDYHHTVQAASGEAAERARKEAMEKNFGKYLLVVDGSIPTANPGFSTIAGVSNLDMLTETAKGAAAIISVGSCAAFGGIAAAAPNPTGAVGVMDLIKDKPIINVPGCPPIPKVITGVLSHYLAFNSLPDLDHLHRPKVFYGQTIHDRCYRRSFYEKGLFAESFDDEGAKQGWCLYKLGCKGPTTYNACATIKWNQGVSFPIESGHPCLGCSEPYFWDKGSFYSPLATSQWIPAETVAAVSAAGAAVGLASAFSAGRRQRQAKRSSSKDETNYEGV